MKADLLFYGGHIHTQDSYFSCQEALAIGGGRILATGSNLEIRGAFTALESIYLEGKHVYPGFIDAHCHLMRYGKSLFEADLTGADSFSAVIRRLQAFAQTHPAGWLIGRGWDHNRWPEKTYPTREMLDRYFPNRPVFLQRIDIHAALVNSLALDLAGIHADSYFPGGEVHRNNGQPTGLLIDHAQEPVIRLLPHDDPELQRAYLLAAQQKCLAAGLTSLGDAWLPHAEIHAIRQLQEKGDFHLRIYGMIPADSWHLDHYLPQGPQQTEQLSLTAFKLFADGALGSRGAWLLEPYTDAPDTTGIALLDEAATLEVARKIYSAGFQLNTHAIGDAANRSVLQRYAQVVQPGADHRWRVEHAQMVRPEDRGLFATYGILPSVQPTHATSDMDWVQQRIGPERLRYAYPQATLLRETGQLAIGSDFPVESIDPLRGFFAAITRKDPTDPDKPAFFPAQCLTPREALFAMTLGNAFAQREEQVKGSLEPGKYADLVVLETDLLNIDPMKIPPTRIYMTVSAGKIVYSA